MGLTRTQLIQSQSRKKKSIRCINALPQNHHTSTYFNSMQLLKLPELQQYFVLIFLYKYIISVRNMSGFTQHFDRHEYHTRNKIQYVLPRYHKYKSQLSFRYRSIGLWNTFPPCIKNCTSLSKFKAALKAYLGMEPLIKNQSQSLEIIDLHSQSR